MPVDRLPLPSYSDETGSDSQLTRREIDVLKLMAAEPTKPSRVVADLPADALAAEPVRQGDGLLDDPAVDAEAGTVAGAAAGAGYWTTYAADACPAPDAHGRRARD